MNQWFEDKRSLFEEFARQYFSQKKASVQDVSSLMAAIEYSFFSGGKRFRPLLCYAVAEAFKLSPDRINAFALAVECVHTYSLLHDDLPCMDDDDIRRGQATTHKKFSENLALLAGDSLLTESFAIITRFYPDEAGELTQGVASSSGLSGMIRGQVIDLGHGGPIESLDDLIKLHKLKTGSLMALCFQGPFILTRISHKLSEPAPEPESKPKGEGLKKQESVLWMQKELTELGLNLGLAFQIKDDLLDFKEDKSFGFVSFLGMDKTHDYFESLNQKIRTSLKTLGLDSQIIRALIGFNEKREK